MIPWNGTFIFLFASSEWRREKGPTQLPILTDHNYNQSWRRTLFLQALLLVWGGRKIRCHQHTSTFILCVHWEVGISTIILIHSHILWTKSPKSHLADFGFVREYYICLFSRKSGCRCPSFLYLGEIEGRVFGFCFEGILEVGIGCS